jgi:two-component system chemotaxis response regulator CheY
VPAVRPTVLITDDDAAIRTLLMTVLTRAGFLVTAANNGQEAMDRIARERFNAIVLDLMMPLMDGFDTIQQMELSDANLAKESVIVVSAASPRDLKKLDEARVFCVIRKPFDIGVLVEAVRRCVSASQARRASFRSRSAG